MNIIVTSLNCDAAVRTCPGGEEEECVRCVCVREREVVCEECGSLNCVKMRNGTDLARDEMRPHRAGGIQIEVVERIAWLR